MDGSSSQSATTQQQSQQKKDSCPKMGPEPTLLSRKEVDALYEILRAVASALERLGVDYIVTGGSLLGAVRQHSILFCDDDIDIAIIDPGTSGGGKDGLGCLESAYDRVSRGLAGLLGKDFSYIVRPWEGGDKVRLKRMPSVFLDLFTLRRYTDREQLVSVIGVKKNGLPQSPDYIDAILGKIQNSAFSQGEISPLFPLWHFNTRKAVEMWPKEVYRPNELFPLDHAFKFGPLTRVQGPRCPVHLLRRAFGFDCFNVFFKSGGHKGPQSAGVLLDKNTSYPPLVKNTSWEGGMKVELEDGQYLPMQPIARVQRRATQHCKQALFQYLGEQTQRERLWLGEEPQGETNKDEEKDEASRERPRLTVYTDGVFDMLHIGHLQAVRQCAALGNRVIVGVTGDEDAKSYKRTPIINEEQRAELVSALRDVDEVVCPCPLVVTEAFLKKHAIDLVVHAFRDEKDAEQQREFFQDPIRLGKFQEISYSHELSTTDIIDKIVSQVGKPK